MARSRWQTVRNAAGALAFASTAAGAFAIQRRHSRSIAIDPEYAVLADSPLGRALSVPSSDGTIIHAEAFGSDDAPTIVLVHGWTEALAYWIYQIRDLSRDFRVVAYDLRGHGASSRPPGGDYSMPRFGDDLEAVLRAAVPSGERATVVGHSLGAMSIAAWAERHDVESRARAAALLNTGVGDLLAEHLLVRYPRFARQFGESISRQVFLASRVPLPAISSPVQHAAIRYFAFGPAATPAQVAYYERMLLACPTDVRANIGIALADMDLHHSLANLTVPTLVLAGDLDRLTPPLHAHRIAAALPDLHELIVLDQTGHMAPLERPAELSAALRELVIGTAETRAAGAAESAARA